MASATVRLYRINPATNGYEAVEGGSPLGCVLVGSGKAFQVLVYNAQVGQHYNCKTFSNYQFL